MLHDQIAQKHLFEKHKHFLKQRVLFFVSFDKLDFVSKNNFSLEMLKFKYKQFINKFCLPLQNKQ